MAAADSGKTQWRELYHEVVATNLCTGCAACVMACPRDVLDYDHTASYHPFNVELTTAFDDCVHGQRGCDICTRACPRFRDWELDCDQALFGRARRPEEVAGIRRGVFLVRATDPQVLEAGQDGGLVSALLVWGLETDRIEGALTSRLSTTRQWDCEPFLATNRAEVLEAAGSRYSYAANPLADVAKVNIKGRFQVWRRSSGEEVDIPLKRMQEATRAGCKLCPDFAAEHADIATGGLGQLDGWTLTVVRTQRGEEWMQAAETAGVLTVRPGEEDPAALALMAKLAVRSRQRWPADLDDGRGAPRMLPVVPAT